MKTTLNSIDSPLVLYSEHDASLAVIRMRRARQLRRQAAADWEAKKRRDLGLEPRTSPGPLRRIIARLTRR